MFPTLLACEFWILFLVWQRSLVPVAVLPVFSTLTPTELSLVLRTCESSVGIRLEKTGNKYNCHLFALPHSKQNPKLTRQQCGKPSYTCTFVFYTSARLVLNHMVINKLVPDAFALVSFGHLWLRHSCLKLVKNALLALVFPMQKTPVSLRFKKFNLLLPE